MHSGKKICGMGMFLILWHWAHLSGIKDKFEYIRILKEILFPCAEEEMPLKWVFQQDYNHKHIP